MTHKNDKLTLGDVARNSSISTFARWDDIAEVVATEVRRRDTENTKATIAHIMKLVDHANTENARLEAVILDMTKHTKKQDDEITLLKAEIVHLRAIFPEILKALDTGAFCSEKVSLEFLQNIPSEVKAVIRQADAVFRNNSWLKAKIEKMEGASK